MVNSQADAAEVHVVLPRKDETVAAGFNPKVHVHMTPMGRVRSPLNLLRVPELNRLVRRLNPDIVHFQSGLVWEYGVLYGPHCSVILTIHDVIEHPSWGGWLGAPAYLARRAMRAVDALIVHGNANRDLLLNTHRKEIGSATVYSVDHGVISRYGQGAARTTVPAGGGNVLFFGRIDKYKGIEYLLDAERLLRAAIPGVSVIVAGSPVRKSYCRPLMERNSTVRFRWGYHDAATVEQLFQWADVLVLPYVEASQSGVLQIGVSFGVPTVATSVGGLPEAVRHRATGLLVPPRDPAGLAAAILEALTDARLRSTMIGNIVAEREGRFSWCRIGAQTLAIYREVIGHHVYTAAHAEVPLGRRLGGGEIDGCEQQSDGHAYSALDRP
ncbi:MAG TPA: glycosyltransferase family 4 protein [Bryobacteraceae bacterium]|nr:glycosyltransferase family 4 protein [Bryobacteraceae bacterium]